MFPQVSVIIPNYNHSSYLKQRIDTVLNQSYQDFELIILDDCSTDSSREIIEQYRGHAKISAIVFNEVNSGTTFQQWKKGIELAKGKYIWIAESDDYCEPTLLATLMDGLLSSEQCVLGYVQSVIVNADGKITRVTQHHCLAEAIAGKTYIRDYLAAQCTICNASMAVFKKDCYHHVSQTFTTYKLCGDWAFWIGIARQGEVFVSGKVLNYFRKHDQDVSGKMYDSGRNFIEELRILHLLKDDGLIADEEFKRHLLNMYIRFIVLRHRIADNVNRKIEHAFFGEREAYKQFLKRTSFYILLRIKIRRRVNLLFKDK